MNTTDTAAEDLAMRHGARRLLVKLLCFAIVMLFAGLTSAYIVSSGSGYWVWLRLPQAFLYSTIAIVLSSAVLQLAYALTKKGKGKQAAGLTAFTLCLGIAFSYFQFDGFKDLYARGNSLAGDGGVLNIKGTYGVDFAMSRKGVPLVLENGDYYLGTDTARQTKLNAEIEEMWNGNSSYLYMLTLLHLAHLALGLIALLVMAVKGFMDRYTATEHIGHWSGTVYWHFLGGLWVFLFLFLTFVH
ncbi:MAG: cytochrome c oxidase subunit 3 [Flavobacteriales bacterium]